MPSARVVLNLRNDLGEMTRLAEELETFCGAHGVSADTLMAMNLALEELVTNTINYGYTDGAEHTIEVELLLEDGSIQARVADDATPYDPLQRQDPDVEASLDERQIGGLGVMLVRKLMDHAAYEHVDGKNVMTIRKRADASN